MTDSSTIQEIKNKYKNNSVKNDNTAILSNNNIIIINNNTLHLYNLKYVHIMH